MIKVESKIKNDNCLIKYSCKNTDTYEHLAVICHIMKVILDHMPGFTLDELVESIKAYYLADDEVSKEKETI